MAVVCAARHDRLMNEPMAAEPEPGKPPPKALLPHVWRAFGFARQGLAATWRTERAFRIEALCCVALSPVALWLGRDSGERSLLIASCLLVLICELLNSALENLADRIGAERHPLSGRAKDQGAAALLLSLALAGLCWGMVIWDRWLL